MMCLVRTDVHRKGLVGRGGSMGVDEFTVAREKKEDGVATTTGRQAYAR